MATRYVDFSFRFFLPLKSYFYGRNNNGRPWQALLLGAAMLTPVGLAAGTWCEMLTPLVARTNVDTTGN